MKITAPLLALALLANAASALAAPSLTALPGDGWNSAPDAQIAEVKKTLDQESAALSGLQTSLAQAQRSENDVYWITVGAAGLSVLTFGVEKLREGMVDLLSHGNQTTFILDSRLGLGAISVVAVTGGFSIYLTEHQVSQIRSEIADAQARIAQDRSQLESLSGSK